MTSKKPTYAPLEKRKTVESSASRSSFSLSQKFNYPGDLHNIQLVDTSQCSTDVKTHNRDCCHVSIIAGKQINAIKYTSEYICYPQKTVVYKPMKAATTACLYACPDACFSGTQGISCKYRFPTKPEKSGRRPDTKQRRTEIKYTSV